MKKYDSQLEKRLHESTLNICKFHDRKDLVNYSIDHTYEPDFTIEKDGKKFLIEVKGRFRDSAEASKYKSIRKFLQKHEELVFIFQNPHVAFPFAKKRKDGTRRTHAEWSAKNKFRYWSEQDFDLQSL